MDINEKMELKEYFYNLMNKANDIWELLIINSKYNRSLLSYCYKEKEQVFSDNLERIAFNNCLIHKEEIKDALNQNISIETIKDQYNVTTFAIMKVLGFNQEFIDYYNIKLTDVIKEQDEEFLCAKAMLETLIRENIMSQEMIKERFSIKFRKYHLYLEILKIKNHKLYIKYDLLKRKKISELNKESVDKAVVERNKKKKERMNEDLKDFHIRRGIFTKRTSTFFAYLQSIDDFNPVLLENMLRMNKWLIYEFINDEKGIKEIYEYYVNLYRQLAKKVIDDIIVCGSEGFKEPIDIYSYYLKNCNLWNIAHMAKEFTDLKNNTLILKYNKKYANIYLNLTDRNLEVIKRVGVFSCCKSTINFTKDEFEKAIDDLNQKGIPIMNGTLYGALKRQIALKDEKKLLKKNGLTN